MKIDRARKIIDSRKKFLLYFVNSREKKPRWDFDSFEDRRMYYKLEKLSFEVIKVFEEVDSLVESDSKFERCACRTICTQRPCCNMNGKKVSPLEFLPTALLIKQYYLNPTVMDRALDSLILNMKKTGGLGTASMAIASCIFLGDSRICQNWDLRPVICRTVWNSSYCMPWTTPSYYAKAKAHGEHRIRQLSIEHGIPRLSLWTIAPSLRYAIRAVNDPQNALSNLSPSVNPRCEPVPVITQFSDEELPDPNFLLF